MTGRQSSTRTQVGFVWENFGPLHVDRLEAIVRSQGEIEPVAFQFSAKSNVYGWTANESPAFRTITLFTSAYSEIQLFRRLVAAMSTEGINVAFFSHYHRLSIFLAALVLRLKGGRAYVMSDSKFDDYPRSLPREVIKSLFYLPYCGALAGSPRSADYLRFLGFRRRPVVVGVNAVSVDRIRDQARAGLKLPKEFSGRHLLVVARFVEKKNIPTVLRAFEIFHRADAHRRKLIICGGGPLEGVLSAMISDLGLSQNVELYGFLQAESIALLMADSLAVVLASTEEQYGQVIAEAVALGAPLLVSTNCGARDELVRTGLNGFIFEPENAAGLAKLMMFIGEDERRWREMSSASAGLAHLADAARFAEGVSNLVWGRTTNGLGGE